MNYNTLWCYEEGSLTKGPLSQFNYAPVWTKTVEEQMYCKFIEDMLLKTYIKINEMERSKRSVLLKNLLTVEVLKEVIEKTDVGASIAASSESLVKLCGFKSVYECLGSPYTTEEHKTHVLVNPPKKGKYKRVGDKYFVGVDRSDVTTSELSDSYMLLKQKKSRFSRKRPKHVFIHLERDRKAIYVYRENANGIELKHVCPSIEMPEFMSLKFEELSNSELTKLLYEECIKSLEKEWGNIEEERIFIKSVLLPCCLK